MILVGFSWEIWGNDWFDWLNPSCELRDAGYGLRAAGCELSVASETAKGRIGETAQNRFDWLNWFHWFNWLPKFVACPKLKRRKGETTNRRKPRTFMVFGFHFTL
jgi:hypothetical protein